MFVAARATAVMASATRRLPQTPIHGTKELGPVTRDGGKAIERCRSAGKTVVDKTTPSKSASRDLQDESPYFAEADGRPTPRAAGGITLLVIGNKAQRHRELDLPLLEPHEPLPRNAPASGSCDRSPRPNCRWTAHKASEQKTLDAHGLLMGSLHDLAYHKRGHRSP